MATFCDFVIVGAGPAGARAAELLATRGASVRLFDPKAPWEKPCGGGLTAAALANTPELRDLDARTHKITELLVVAPGGASVVVPLRTPFRTVSRVVLSEWGLERARSAGATFRAEAVRSVSRRGRGWRIETVAGQSLQSRWLVAADGATSPLRRRLAPGFRPELAPTRVVYSVEGSAAGRAVFLFFAGTDGYLWDFPRDGHHSLGAGVPPQSFGKLDIDDAIDQYALAEHGAPPTAPRRGAVIATSLWRSGRFRDLGGSDFALLGDAAGLADPATGEGIDYAFRSATIAVRAFDEVTGFAAYPDLARKAFEREIRRARLLRTFLYYRGIANHLVRYARRSARGALLLMSLVDAVNEHESFRAALLRAIANRSPDRSRSLAICDCPDGSPQAARASQEHTAGPIGMEA